MSGLGDSRANALKPVLLGKVEAIPVEIPRAAKDRVLIIGPVLPYRGGIAQHTTMLHRALRQQADCLTISFTRQYPTWMFPGESDREKVATDAEEDVEYLIDAINPVTWARAIRHAMAFAPRRAVFPWWHVYWVPCFSYLARALRKSGVEVVFLCHNAVEHESAAWKRQLTRIALSHADRFVVHTEADRRNLLALFPATRVDVHPHPLFEQFPDAADVLPRRARLELLFFGFVRAYKGLDLLLEAMDLLKSEDVFLSVVGEFWEGEERAREFIHARDLAVEVVARYVSGVEAANYFARCDAVVLPYRSATGSGVVALAYRYGKPVIVTRVGGLPDVVEEGVTGVIVDPESPEALAQAIMRALQGHRFSTSEGLEDIKSRLTWNGLARVVLDRSDVHA